MIHYYVITTFVTLVGLLILIFNYKTNKVNFFFLLIMLLMTIANAGYLAIALSTTLSEAILANKFCYISGCFNPPVLLFLICEICNYKVPKWLRVSLYSYSFIVYMMVLTIGFNTFYYDTVFLKSIGGVTVLGHTYGIGHIFFNVIVYGYVVAQAALLLYSIIKKKTVSQKSLLALIIVNGVNVCMFGVGRVFLPDVEVMALTYAIDSCIFIYMYRRSRMYSIEDNVIDCFSKQQANGYIMFDNHLNFLGCNNIAIDIFPALSECRVDRSIRKKTELKAILFWVDNFVDNENEIFEYETEERHYECHVEYMWYRKNPCGYMIELREDTSKWKYVKLLSVHNAELERFQTELENKVDEQTIEIRAQQEKQKKLFLQTVIALSEAVDASDRYTSGHSKRVAKYASMIADRMGKSKEEQEDIYCAGLLHDVGKIRIPGEIINKPGKLTDEEYNTIKIHTITGYHILKGISDNNYIAVAAKYHHERYDGKGYPNGLAGENIPEVARIIGVADAYDAMASNRSYRNALPQDVVRSEIEKGRGTQFDPIIADIMLQMMAEDETYNMKQADTMHRCILSVDDDAMNNKIVAHIMRDEPMYEVVSALNGNEALAILGRQAVDLILLDVNMPEMDGLETLKRIREQYQTPVVLMTSDRTLDIAIEYSTYGCDNYITKPLIPLIVKEIVHNMTEQTNIES